MGWITAVVDVGVRFVAEVGFFGGGFLLGAVFPGKKRGREESLLDGRCVLLAMVTVIGVSFLAMKVSILVTPEVLVLYGESFFFRTKNVNIQMTESGNALFPLFLGTMAGVGVFYGYMSQRNRKHPRPLEQVV